jgi:hypothetical protein
MEADPTAWVELAAAIVVASVAFAGFIFVALSINVDEVISMGGIPQLALQGLVMLTSIAISAIFLLVPGVTDVELGLELLVLGVFLVLFIAFMSWRSYRATTPEYRMNRIVGGIFYGLPGVFMAIAGASLIIGSGGLDWLVPAWVTGIVTGIINAWVLLVEIKR